MSNAPEHPESSPASPAASSPAASSKLDIRSQVRAMPVPKEASRGLFGENLAMAVILLGTAVFAGYAEYRAQSRSGPVTMEMVGTAIFSSGAVALGLPLILGLIGYGVSGRRQRVARVLALIVVVLITFRSTGKFIGARNDLPFIQAKASVIQAQMADTIARSQAATKAFEDAGGFDLATLGTPELLDARADLAEKAITAHRQQLDWFRGLEETVRREFKTVGISADGTEKFLRGMTAEGRRTPKLILLSEQNVESFELVRTALVRLRAQHGKWSVGQDGELLWENGVPEEEMATHAKEMQRLIQVAAEQEQVQKDMQQIEAAQRAQRGS